MTHPDVSNYATGDLTESQLTDLWTLVCTELADPEFTNWTHGNPRTYIAGCRGPVCRGGARQKNRKGNPTGDFVWLEPLVEYFRKTAVDTINAELAKMLERITA